MRDWGPITAKCRNRDIFPLKRGAHRSTLRSSKRSFGMAGKRTVLDEAIDAVTDRLSDLLGALAPEPEAIPIPVRKDDPRRRR